MANNALLEWVMQHIEGNQQLWDQTAWARINTNGFTNDQLKRMVLEDPFDPACGSAKCFAGWAAVKSGWLPVFSVDDFFNRVSPTAETCIKDGEEAAINTKAAELLDIDIDTTGKLFSATNRLEQLREMVDIIKEHGTLDIERECEDCSGSGETYCDCCGNETSCENCGGTGNVET